jgi:hypothetical protein
MSFALFFQEGVFYSFNIERSSNVSRASQNDYKVDREREKERETMR